MAKNQKTQPELEVAADEVVQDTGVMTIVSKTGGVAVVPKADMAEYPDYEPAVAGVHF